jgi:hypothetical protein
MRVRFSPSAPLVFVKCCLRLLARIPAFQAGETGSIPVGSAISLPLRLTAGCRTLNAVIVVRIHEGERRCSSAEERRSHTAKGGCSNQPTGTNFESELIPAVVQWSERLNVNQVTHVRFVPQGPIERGCSSAEERRSPKPRQRGFDPCLPRHPNRLGFDRRPRKPGRSPPPVHGFFPQNGGNLLKNKAFFRSNLLALMRD